MRAADIISRAWRENLLYTALIELTYRCNLDCFFCYNDVDQQGTPLAAEQYERFLRDLADLQVMEIILTGGEPLAHADFFRLGATARELGFVVRIKSNGHALGGALARRVKEEVDPFVVDISLHGATAEIHDRQTRIPGSFDKLMRNLAEMKQLGLRLKLNGTLTRWNQHQIEDMSRLAKGFGIPLTVTATVTPRDDGNSEPLTIAASDEALRELSEFRYREDPGAPRQMSTTAAKVGGEVEKNCGAGSSAIAVDPFGNVYPCVQWRRSLGNLHETSIKEIWAGSDELDEIRTVTTEAKRRKSQLGRIGASMNFCPGLSEEKTGDPLALDPDAVREAELLDEFLRRREQSPLRVVP